MELTSGISALTQQERLSSQGANQWHQDLAVVDGLEHSRGRWQSEDSQRVNIILFSLITEKYREYTEEYLKILETKYDELRK